MSTCSRCDFLAQVQTAIKNKDPVWRFPDENREIPLSRLWKDSDLYASVLADFGIKPNDRVGISIGSQSGFSALILAVFKTGAVAVPIKPLRGVFKEIREFLFKVQDLSPLDLVIFDEESDAGIIGEWSMKTGKPNVSWQNFLEKTDNADSVFCLMPACNETAVIQYSSGSTGSPKGVIVTWNMVITQIKQLGSAYNANGGSESDCFNSSWLPLHHDMGLFMGVLFPLYLGIQNLLASPMYFMARPVRWYQHISDMGVTLSFTTNSAMAFCLKQLERVKSGTLDLSRLHQYFGAEKVSPVILRRSIDTLMRLGIKPEHVAIGYGMAENALGATQTQAGAPRIVQARISSDNNVVICKTADENTVELVSCGTAFCGVEISIRDENDNPQNELKLGEISVKGPCVTPGYINNPDGTSEILPEHGRLLTKDLGFIFEGELYFHARKDDLLIAGGRNIVPDDIEMAVENLDFVKQGSTALIGVENTTTGLLEIHLLVESKPEQAASILQERRIIIREAVRKSFGLLLNQIHFCEKNTIEKTSSGKKRRKVIRNRFAAQEIKLLLT